MFRRSNDDLQAGVNNFVSFLDAPTPAD